MWKWINSNRVVAGVIALALMVAFTSAADGYRTRKLLKAAQTSLEEADKAKERELADAKKAWDQRDADAGRRLAPVLRERDALRAKVAALEAERSKPFVAPATDSEIVSRFEALGYLVRVR